MITIKKYGTFKAKTTCFGPVSHMITSKSDKQRGGSNEHPLLLFFRTVFEHFKSIALLLEPLDALG